MNEWININECMKKYMNEKNYKWMNKKMKDEWIWNYWMKKWMNDEWMNEWMNEWMYEWMNEWMNEWVEVTLLMYQSILKIGMINEWINALINQRMNTYIIE